jgi:DNA-directed RNA polymerase subunit F
MIKEANLSLTESEVVQLVNLLPETDVEFYLILENCSERFTEDQINQMKEMVQRIRQQQQKTITE